MDEAPREVQVDAEAVGCDADIDAHKEDGPTTLDFFGTALVQDVADDKKDLANLKQASAKVVEVLYISWLT